MSAFEVTPQSLANTIRQITEGLLSRRLEDKAKSYVKIDFHVTEEDKFFTARITKCSSGSLNLKFLLTTALKGHLGATKLAKQSVVATVEEKSSNALHLQNVVCTRNTSISLVHQADLDLTQSMREFSLLKRYTSINLLFQVEKEHFDTFATLMLCHIMEVEQLDPNVKFSFRKNGVHIYRNRVRMDDIILSCMLLGSYCANIFQKSLDEHFRGVLERSLELRKPSEFEKTVGCLLLAQADCNFVAPRLKLTDK